MDEQGSVRKRERFHASGGVVGGLVTIAVGAILLLDRMGVVEGRQVLKYWPLALLAYGVYALVTPCGSRVWGVLLTVIGGLLSLRPLGLPLSIFELWPVFLIAIGVVMLWGSVAGRSRRRGAWYGGDLQKAAGSYTSTTSDDLNEWTVFGGGERQIATNDFRGGKLLVIFGGWDIDLTHAAMQQSEAVIDIRCVFGGVSFRIPEDWDVTVRAVALLGGIGDNTRHPRGEALNTAKRLIITGSAVLGGIELRN